MYIHRVTNDYFSHAQTCPVTLYSRSVTFLCMFYAHKNIILLRTWIYYFSPIFSGTIQAAVPHVPKNTEIELTQTCKEREY